LPAHSAHDAVPDHRPAVDLERDVLLTWASDTNFELPDVRLVNPWEHD
jgi:hypothetical protein